MPISIVRIAAVLALILLAACQGGLGSIAPQGAAASAEARTHVAEIRRANGMQELRPDRTLDRAALQQAGNMAQAARMSHSTGLGRDFASRMRANGIRIAGENIAHGRFGTAEVLEVWMNSSGHRANMLNPDFSSFGLAYAVDPADSSRRYWVMVLGD